MHDSVDVNERLLEQCDLGRGDGRIDAVLRDPQDRPATPVALLIDLRERSTEAGAAVFLKQLGSVWARENGSSGKAHDMDEWPEQLRKRNMPVLGVAAVGDLLAR